MQFAAEVTEHAHTEVVKDLFYLSNNYDYDPQIAHAVNHLEKIRLFNLTMFSIRTPKVTSDNINPAVAHSGTENSVHISGSEPGETMGDRKPQTM